MNVKDAIESRRAFRSLKETKITEELVKDLAYNAGLAPSCFNKQPWRFVFVYSRGKLNELRGALSQNNEWAYRASLIIAVFSEKKNDCIVQGREYYLFDTGMAAGFLMLRATELGLVAHPIAGFSEEKVKTILGIPGSAVVITLINVGIKDGEINELLTDKQAESEDKRPPRLDFNGSSYINEYKPLHIL